MKIQKALIFGYIMWGALNYCRSLEPFPSTNGCSVTRRGCALSAYCNYYFDVSFESEEISECDSKIRLGTTNYLPINVVIQNGTLQPYRENNDRYPNYNYNGESFIRSPNVLVQSFDLSNNNYEIVPDITNFINLKHLNMSHNILTAAELFNSVDLDYLEEIDMSFNSIEKFIELRETEMAYKGLKTLNLSHNFLSNLPEEFFYNFIYLENLDLSYNRITNLNMFTFHGLRKMSNLNLGTNLIKSLDLSLAKLSTLEKLCLNHNKITRLMNADLHELTRLKHIDFSYNKINNVERELFKNMSYLTSVNLRNNYLKFIDKEMFSDNDGLEIIDLSHNNITKISTRIFKDKHIKYFCIIGNKIKGTLTKGIFEGMHLVNNLDMSYQDITSIQDYAFFGIENISELFLNNNNIGTISNKSFKLLTKLKRLELSHNSISNITADFEDLISLEFLSLAYNELIFIKKSYLQCLDKLEFLDLSNNKIITIEEFSFHSQAYLKVFLFEKNELQGPIAQNTFNGLQAITSLDLVFTSLTIISNGSFDGMTLLHYMNISHGTLGDLGYNSFLNTGKLEILDLSFNRLTHFNINTTDLGQLKSLNLQNNLITTLSETFDKDFKLMQKLVLSYNNLLFIPDKSLRNQNYLEYLDLSHNLNLVIDNDFIRCAKKIKTLLLSSTKSQHITFARSENLLTKLEMSNSSVANISTLNLFELKHLSNLVLSNNEVTKLLAGTFRNMSSLYSLDVSYNKIMYLQAGLFQDCYYLHILNVSHNSLININYGVFLGLSGLNILDVSYNLLSSLKDEQFYGIESLRDLIVDYNEISGITINDFLGDIRKLSIGGNPIPCTSLISLHKQYGHLNITAITLENTSLNHIYYGVTCIGENYKENKLERIKNETTTDKDLKVLLDIRNTLGNIENNSVHGDILSNLTKVLLDLKSNVVHTDEKNSLLSWLKNFQNESFLKYEQSNFNEIKRIGDNINSEIKQVTLKTNSLLEKILVILADKNSSTTSIKSLKPHNNDVSNDTTFLERLKELENSFIIEKERIVSEFDDKIIELNKRINIKKLEVSSENNNMRNPTFTEVCVAIILLILCCCIVFYIYKSKLNNVGSLSLSTRRMTEDIENSNL